MTEAAIARAEEAGYRFQLRHQPGADDEQPDWIVVIRTPEGRTVFPAAIDDDEASAWSRAARWAAEQERTAR